MTTPQINWQSWHVKQTPYYQGFSRRLEAYTQALSTYTSAGLSLHGAPEDEVAAWRATCEKGLEKAFRDLYSFASQMPQPELNEHGDPVPSSELAPHGTAVPFDKLSPYMQLLQDHGVQLTPVEPD